MKVGPPALLPLLRTSTQGELLAVLFLNPDQRYSASDLARRLGVSLPTVLREVGRLVEAGLLTESGTGRPRWISANTESLLFAPLAELVALTYGPIPVLTELLSGVPGVEAALIFGSWAARYRGVRGAAPRDVDVLVVGSADADTLFDVAEQGRAKLGRAVDIRQVTPQAWQDRRSNDPFLTEVRRRPQVPLELEGVS